MSDDLLTQRLLDEIVETEKAERKAQLKWLTPKSLIKTTKEVAAEAKSKIVLDDKPFTIYRNLKLDLIIWVLMACLIISPMIYIIVREIKSNNANVIGITFASFLVVLFLFVGYKNLTLKSLTLPITFTTKDLTINDEVFNWNEIHETFYVYRFPGRIIKSFFIIGFQSGIVQYFDIGNQLGFKYNDRDFSKFVEHYKQFTSPNKSIAASGADTAQHQQ